MSIRSPTAQCVALLLTSTLGCTDPRCSRNEFKDGNVCREIRASDSSPDSSIAESPEEDASGANTDDATASRSDGSSGSADLVDSSLVLTPSACWVDADGDGYGAASTIASCPVDEPAPSLVDCDDGDANVHPEAAELCNGKDDDCSTGTSDGVGACGSYACRDGACADSCALDAECRAGLHCVNGGCLGGNDNAPCASDAECTSGSCRPSGSCGPKVTLGEACDTPADCQPGSTCGQHATCQLAVGAACVNNAECASTVCYLRCLSRLGTVGSGCDDRADCGAGLQCVANACRRLSGACATDAECSSGLCIGGECRPMLSTVEGKCDVTADCRPDQNLTCEDSKCRYAAGAPCMKGYSGCVAGYQCYTGTCLPE